MKCQSLPGQWILACLFFAVVGCSGSSGDKDGSSPGEVRGAPDGGGSRIDGASQRSETAPALDGAGPSSIDTAPTSNDVRVSGEAGSDAKTVDLTAGVEAAQLDVTGAALDAGTNVEGGLRDSGPAPADLPSSTPDVADSRIQGADVTPDVVPVVRDTAPDTISTGNAIVDRLAVAVASCGSQSHFTVPVGWQMVMVGDKGCTFYAPPNWLSIGAGTPTTFVVEDSTRVTGSSVLAGVDTTGTATCTPHGIASWLFANNQDCVGYQELYWKDSVDDIAGIQIPRGDLVYSCTQGGVPIAGYLMAQIHGTWPFCNMVVMAFWMPQTQIESRTCTLTQTLNSIQCPHAGGGCDDASCAQDCIANGSQTGFCDADGSCVCS
jgi:hypothetical protein